MRITALVDSPAHVCCRYRLAAYRPILEEHGHTLQLRPWPPPWLSGLLLCRYIGAADVVVVQRRLLAAWQLYLLRRVAPRLVFDFDDAVFLRDSYAARGSYSNRLQRRFIRTVQVADAVVAGNAFLADEAAQWTEAGRIYTVPTCIDSSHYRPASHERSREVELAWIGSASTLQGLERSRRLWEEIGRWLPGIRLKVICDRPLALEHLPVHFVPWAESTEAAELTAADIGISWLPDDRWSEGKCGLKVLQYMAAGLPVVANPVGLQAQLVRDGETGFGVRTPDEWVQAIARLAGDPALRRRLGAAGRTRVEAEFSVSRGARTWLSLLDDLLPTPAVTHVPRDRHTAWTGMRA